MVTLEARKRIEVHNLSGELVDAQDLLEQLTYESATAADRAAETEVAFKHRLNRRLVELMDADAGLPRSERLSDPRREAKAMIDCEDVHRAYLHARAVEKSSRDALHAARSRVEVCRTLIASERALMA